MGLVVAVFVNVYGVRSSLGGDSDLAVFEVPEGLFEFNASAQKSPGVFKLEKCLPHIYSSWSSIVEIDQLLDESTFH